MLDTKLLSPINQELANQEWLTDLEQQWRESLPRLKDKQLLDTFPEVKQDLPDIINEVETENRYIKYKIAEELFSFTSRYKSQNDQILAREGLKIALGQELMANWRQLSRLHRLQNLANGNTGKKGGITDQDIQVAQEVPIENLFDGRLRKSGKTLIGLCPFHSEKHSSFYIYPATNSYYCFGCQNGGNSINFVMNLNGLNFKAAVKLLTNS